MTPIADRHDVVAQLDRLRAQGQLPPRSSKLCLQLRTRLSRPVCVGLLGPQQDSVGSVLERSLPDDTHLIFDAQYDDFDMPIWCGAKLPDQDYGWQALDPALQDRSLFVIATDDTPDATALLQRVSHGPVPVLVLALNDYANRTTFCETVKARLRAGQSADMDTAQMLLQRFGGDFSGASVKHSAVSEQAEIAPMQAAADYIRAVASDLADHPLDGDNFDVAPILELCREAAASLAAMAQEHGHPPIKAATQAADEQIQLLELEGDVSSAIDSVTCLLQLKRDLTVQLTH